MTVRPAVVLARLAHLGQVLGQLEHLRGLPTANRQDPVVQLAAERAVQVAIEAVLDVGHHVLAGRGRPLPKTYPDVPPSLAAAGLFTQELAGRLEGMAGMRNILVHDYVRVTPERVWSVIDERLTDLRAAQAAFATLPELDRGV